MAPPRVKLELVHRTRLDLSVLLIGSTSSDKGYSDRFGLQLTYLSGEKLENKDFFPCFLKFFQALSQSWDDLSPDSCTTNYNLKLRIGCYMLSTKLRWNKTWPSFTKKHGYYLHVYCPTTINFLEKMTWKKRCRHFPPFGNYNFNLFSHFSTMRRYLKTQKRNE